MYDLLTFFLKFKCNREKNLLQPGFPLQFSSSTLSFRFLLLFILLLLPFFKKNNVQRHRYQCSPYFCVNLILFDFNTPQKKTQDYIKQSKFVFLPQIHDASPRVSTQALALDKPLLTNWHISGGWKYMNADPKSHESSTVQKTGEYFHDMRDFRQSLEKLMVRSPALVQGTHA